MVELALVLPVFITLIFGIMNFSWLIFQQQSVTSAARDAAREAALLNPLFENGTATGCTSKYGEPSATQASPATPIEVAAASGSALVPINTSAICATSATDTSMTSSSTQSGTGTVTVTASPSLAAPSTVTVTITYVAHPLSPIFPTASITLTASSTENVET